MAPTSRSQVGIMRRIQFSPGSHDNCVDLWNGVRVASVPQTRGKSASGAIGKDDSLTDILAPPDVSLSQNTVKWQRSSQNAQWLFLRPSPPQLQIPLSGHFLGA